MSCGVVDACEGEDGAVELFGLCSVAEFVELPVVSSLSKSCTVFVGVWLRWEEC